MYEDVLIPTDGSEGAKRGVEYAIDIASKYGATVHTLYVVDERIYGGTPALSSDELFLEELENRGDEALDEVEAKAKEFDLEVARACKRGVPHEVILEYTDEHDIDLIVMGRHGQAEHGHPHIGSCTDRVVRLADVPVLPV
jgi:nucleotide-binding universal stress UspA family protein